MQTTIIPKNSVTKIPTINNTKTNKQFPKLYVQIIVNAPSFETLKKRKETKILRYLPTNASDISVLLKKNTTTNKSHNRQSKTVTIEKLCIPTSNTISSNIREVKYSKL